MPRPLTLRCRVPDVVQRFNAIDIDTLERYVEELNIPLILEYYDPPEVPIEELPKELRETPIPRDAMMEFLRDVCNSMIEATEDLLQSGIELPRKVLLWSTEEIEESGWGCPLLGRLQQVLQAAALDVHNYGFFADIHERHLPSLKELYDCSAITRFQYELPYYLDHDFRGENPLYVRGARGTIIRFSLAWELPRQYRHIFAYVCEAAYEWLADLQEAKCWTCGCEIADVSVNRKYCSNACRQAWYRHRSKRF